MVGIINSLRRMAALTISLLLIVFVTPNNAPAHSVLDEDNCKMCITALSDVHIEGNNFETYKTFGRVLLDAKNNSFGNDVGIFLGDNTMNGQEIESLLFYGLVNSFSFADSYINTVGNHDIGNGEGNYNFLANRFYGYSKEFFGITTDKPYYCKVIDGVYFIVLGSEELCVHEPVFSAEEFAFLKENFDKAQAEGAITFICCHHPDFDFTQETSDAFWNIIKRGKNVFVLSGHTHAPLSPYWTFDKYLGVNLINLPKCTESYSSDTVGYYGLQLEIYDDELVARFRDFYNGAWVNEYENHYTLQK